MKLRRESEGLSIRALSSIIGVSFSSLARIERGEGEPDNNSQMRIIEWLGQEALDAGFTLSDAAFVHFRAAKNVSSKTVENLLEVATNLKFEYDYDNYEMPNDTEALRNKHVPLNKDEMEELAINLRSQLNLSIEDIFPALSLKVFGVEVLKASELSNRFPNNIDYLLTHVSNEWSAMSVPLHEAAIKWVIIRNDSHSIERQRVTYLEEIWHILLGHKLTKIAKLSGSYGRTYDDDEEKEAFYLATATLLPKVSVERLVKDRITALDIAEQYKTSPELVEYRIKRLGLWSTYKGLSVNLVGSE